MTSKLKGRTIRCILFDLGNTLWTHVNQASWDKVEYAATQRAIDFLSQHLVPEQQSKVTTVTHGKQLRAAIRAKIFELSRLHPGAEPHPSFAVQEALLEFGLPRLSRTICHDFFEALRIPTIESRVLFDDTCSTLAALQQRGFLLGVVTNRPWGGKPFLEGMRKLGLLEYFNPHHIAISADLGVRKPNPAIFLHALNAFDVKPEEAVMVGDSLHADILGAKELNMIAVWKPKLHFRAELQALQTVDDDALLAYAFEAENKRYQSAHKFIKPDVIIEHVHDLLGIVEGAGNQ
ncbi:MAG TPA: HAD-IA family hydrolase [Ktedonobacteraceae bacterium]